MEKFYFILKGKGKLFWVSYSGMTVFPLRIWIMLLVSLLACRFSSERSAVSSQETSFPTWSPVKLWLLNAVGVSYYCNTTPQPPLLPHVHGFQGVFCHMFVLSCFLGLRTLCSPWLILHLLKPMLTLFHHLFCSWPYNF